MTTVLKTKKEKPTICKAKGCKDTMMANCNYCEKHWFPCNKPEDQLIIPEFLQSQFDFYKNQDEQRAKDGYIHISSLNLCIRENVFRMIDRKPLRPIQLKWYSTGNAIHHKLQVLVAKNPQYQIEKPVIHKNIIAHIDIYDNNRKIPFEAKSLVSGKQEVPKNFHVDQLKMYMALTDDDIGCVLYDPLLDYSDDPFAEWTVRMTKEERVLKLEEMEQKAEIYARAIEFKNAEIAPHINYDPEYNWHCEKCSYADECAAMRAKEPERQMDKGGASN